MTDDAEGGPRPLILTLLFAAIAVLMAGDLADDWHGQPSAIHLVLEVAVVILAGFGVYLLWRAVFAARRRAQHLRADLHLARADAERWRAEAQDALRGLGAAIDRQFARWDLTAAEREVALLLLKGLSHKEIAADRDTSERTVRQQALAIYRKADLHGRAELAAFFLEDLLLPKTP